MSVFLQWKLQVEVVYEESFHCHTTGWFKMLRFHHKWHKDNWSFYNRSFGNWTLDNWSIYNSLNFKQKHWKNDLWQLIFDNWSNSKISSTLLNLWQRIIFTIELLYNYWTLDNDPLDNCSIGQIINWTTDPLESASAIQKFQKITCWTFNSQKDQLSRLIFSKVIFVSLVLCF